MEDMQSSEQLLNDKLVNVEFRNRNRKNGTTDQCIICQKKITGKLGDRRNEGCDFTVTGEQTDKLDKLQDIVQKTVVNNHRFLKTFNDVWRVLNEDKVNQNGGSDSDDEISLESVIGAKKVPRSKGKFSKVPTICQPCCEKILAVWNLMKAVKQQVREIQMLLEQSKRKPQEDEFEDVEKELDGQTANLNADVEIKEEEDDCHWQELSNSSRKSDPKSPQERGMECDEDLPNSLDDQDTAAGAAADVAIEDDGEDDSNWAWEDDDPDYIKSEQEDSDDDDTDEELTSEDELDEEPLTLEENQNSPAIPSDPLEIPASTKAISKKMKLSAEARPGPSSSPNQIACDVKGCPKKFNLVSTLLKHKKECHTVGKSTSGFTCDLEACTRTLPTKEALLKHKMLCHTELYIQMGKLDPKNKFPCSCGRTFPTERKRYTHQRKNTSAHPDFQFKWREYRNQLAGGQPCDMCGVPVKLPNIVEHLSSHVGAEYVVKCPNFKECGHAFTHSKDFTGRHLFLTRFINCKKICDEIKFGLTCETCGFTTYNRIRLATHVTNEHERGTRPKNLSCPISSCEKMFATKQSIFLHLHVHRFRRKVLQNCEKCGKDIKVEEMEKHLKDEHGISKIFECKQCPLKFPEKEGLVEHLWEHKDSGLFCDICGDVKPVKFLKYGDFRDHYFGVHNLYPKKYKCGDCENRCFWRNAELYKHQVESHRKTGKRSSLSSTSVKKKTKTEVRHKCEICEVSFVAVINLIKHNIKVHGADPFRCDICGENFADKPKFSRHKKEHAGMEFKKEWKCEVEGCGKIFGARKNWKGHIERMHVAEKKFVCDDCGKRYALAKGLREHRNSAHLGIRPWICEECGEGFTDNAALKRHKLIHTGERPFGCEICGQRFRHTGVLKRHLEGHEKKGPDFKPNGPMKQIRKRKGQ